MANTVNVTATSTEWTIVAAGPASGLLTSEGKGVILYRENSSLPAPAEIQPAHSQMFFKNMQPQFRYTVLAGQNVYVRTVSQDVLLANTPD